MSATPTVMNTLVFSPPRAAGSRCHHLLRTLPPSQTGEYADGHDLGMMQAMESLLGGLTGEVSHRLWAHHLASLPMRLGGLGLRSARRMSQEACWASWADALNMIEQRFPRMAENIVTSLEDGRLRTRAVPTERTLAGVCLSA